MSVISIAVLITCFNRRQETLTCLSRLFSQVNLDSLVPFQATVYLVDDGSTDGTSECVRSKYPEVIIIKGHGDLFWNGGMRLAFETAMKSGHDFYLWLNDDTFLYQDAISRLLESFNTLANHGHSKSILVGSTQDANTGLLTYGGVNRYSWWYPLKFVTVNPDSDLKRCDSMHGNCVLIPQLVAKSMGNLDSSFVHHLSDFDYGFRANKKGFSVWTIPGFVGTCSFHEPAWREDSLSLRERFKAVNHPKGLALHEWKIYAQRHGGFFWPIYWLSPYAKLIIAAPLVFFASFKSSSS